MAQPTSLAEQTQVSILEASTTSTGGDFQAVQKGPDAVGADQAGTEARLEAGGPVALHVYGGSPVLHYDCSSAEDVKAVVDTL